MKKLTALLFIVLIMGQVQAQNLRVGSYNIRYANEHDAQKGNGWEQRGPVQIQLIQFYEFDILGAQEVLHPQLLDLLAGLPQYDYIGVGRDDGKTEGEYAPIFYKKDRFSCLKSGQFWLSEETTYPNKGWDAALPRICTWGKFKDLSSEREFWYFNLHMDHVGVKARRESAKLVLSKITEMCGSDPVILTGDFNVDQTHSSYQILHDSELLEDSFETAQIRYALNGTFNAFNVNLKTDSRIDHVFVSPSFSVRKYGVLTDTYRSAPAEINKVHEGDFPKEVSFEQYEIRLPSDHFPVLVDLVFE